MSLALHPRLALDLRVRDIAQALSACVRRPDASHEAAALEDEWGGASDSLAALSVRSAFDLYLSALALPNGSEVLLSAVTIPDMPRIVREHGLVPVPVDVGIHTLFPTPADCDRAWSPRSRLLVVTQLFGGRNDLTPLVRWARERGLPIAEDCAQAFVAPSDRGTADADATFYSFGTIKTATALGGALARIADPAILARMRAAQAAWPEQSTTRYRAKVLRAGALLTLQRAPLYGSLALLSELNGRDFDRLIQDSVRGFPVPPGGQLGPMLRFRPCGAMLAMLRHRFATFDPARLHARAEQGERVVGALQRHARVLGDTQAERTHWLVAFESIDRAASVQCGRAMGLDVAAGASSIAAVPRPVERPDLAPTDAERFMRRICFVPAQPEIPREALQQVGDVARAAGPTVQPSDAQLVA